MATLFLPASPNLFPMKRRHMDEDGENESVPNLYLAHDEWDVDTASSLVGSNSEAAFVSPPHLTDTIEEYHFTQDDQAAFTTSPDTSMETSKDDDDEPTSNLAVFEIGDESTSPSVVDREMNNAMVDDADDDSTEAAPVIPGGLNNLGNTCYMASAIQMLASLDPLMNRLMLELKFQQQQQDALATAAGKKESLLLEFLKIVNCLRQGETVRPDTLKQILDEKTPLFCGYEQQDAHEFITALLDILDEEFKKLSSSEEKKEKIEDAVVKKMPLTEATENDEPQDDNSLVSSPDKPGLENEAMDIDNTQQEGVFYLANTPQRTVLLGGDESPSKRFKAGSEQEEDPAAAFLTPVVSRHSSSPSFAGLNMDEIGLLIHGTPGPGSAVSSSDICAASEPRYKLVGGRMSLNQDMRIDSVTAPASHLDRLAERDEDHYGMASEAIVASDDTTDRPASQFSSEAVSSEQTETQEEKEKHVSPIDSYLTTEARVRLTCDSCKYTRTHKETFWHLSLELDNSSSTVNSVQDGLARFFAPEQRQLKCERCFCETATQTMEITKLPQALLLHFKRFIIEVSADYSSVSYRKNRSPVSFDTRMTVRECNTNNGDDKKDDNMVDSAACVLSEFMAPDCVLPSQPKCLNETTATCCFGPSPQRSEYALKSVVNHIGSSASCGHYTADAHRHTGPDRNDKQWLRFNDSFVSRITEMQATEGSASTAYMILYEVE